MERCLANLNLHSTISKSHKLANSFDVEKLEGNYAGVVFLGYFYHPEKNADSLLFTSCKVKVGLCGIDQIVQKSDGFFESDR